MAIINSPVSVLYFEQRISRYLASKISFTQQLGSFDIFFNRLEQQNLTLCKVVQCHKLNNNKL